MDVLDELEDIVEASRYLRDGGDDAVDGLHGGDLGVEVLGGGLDETSVSLEVDVVGLDLGLDEGELLIVEVLAHGEDLLPAGAVVVELGAHQEGVELGEVVADGSDEFSVGHGLIVLRRLGEGGDFCGEGSDGSHEFGEGLLALGLGGEDEGDEFVVGFLKAVDGRGGVGGGEESGFGLVLLDAVAKLEEFGGVGGGAAAGYVVVAERDDAGLAEGLLATLIKRGGLIAEQGKKGGELGVILADAVFDLGFAATFFDEGEDVANGGGGGGDGAGVVGGLGPGGCFGDGSCGGGGKVLQAAGGLGGVGLNLRGGFAFGQGGEGGGVVGEGLDGGGAEDDLLGGEEGVGLDGGGIEGLGLEDLEVDELIFFDEVGTVDEGAVGGGELCGGSLELIDGLAVVVSEGAAGEEGCEEEDGELRRFAEGVQFGHRLAVLRTDDRSIR